MPKTNVRPHTRRTKNGKFVHVQGYDKTVRLVNPPSGLKDRKFLLSRADWTRSPVTYKRDDGTYRNPKTGNIYKKSGGSFKQVGKEETKQHYYGAGG